MQVFGDWQYIEVVLRNVHDKKQKNYCLRCKEIDVW